MKYGNIIKDSSEISKLIASVKEKAEKLLYNGNPFPAADAEPAAVTDESVRVYDRTGRFIGIYRPDEKNNRRILRPVRLFL